MPSFMCVCVCICEVRKFCGVVHNCANYSSPLVFCVNSVSPLRCADVRPDVYCFAVTRVAHAAKRVASVQACRKFELELLVRRNSANGRRWSDVPLFLLLLLALLVRSE